MQKKYDELFAVKLQLEKGKLDLELELRSQRYQHERSKEELAASEGICHQLQEQLKKAESRLLEEVEARQSAELRRKEIEVEFRALKSSNQQVQLNR